MTKYKVVITKSAQRQLDKLPDSVATHLEEKMLELEDNPRPQGCIKLKDREGYRIRVGDYRIIYGVEDKILIVTILMLGHRREIYR